MAIAGATGAIGEALIEALEKVEFSIGELYLLASEESIGETRMYKNRPLAVANMEDFDFDQVQLVFFALPEEVSANYIERVALADCYLIDFSRYSRMDSTVPLVVAGVNTAEIDESDSKHVALPDSLTVDLSHVLKPIHEDVEIVRVNTATYQGVSSAGREGVRELALQASNRLSGLPLEGHVFAHEMAFNIVPQIGALNDSGHSMAELGLVSEIRRVMADQALIINATCVQVPIFYGSCQAISIETRYPVTVEEIIGVLQRSADIEVFAESSSYPVPLAEASSANTRCVGRIRASLGTENGIDLWLASDNACNSAAENAVDVAKLLLKDLL
jgi:aspartate-semialdehyde dehydrogenase